MPATTGGEGIYKLGENSTTWSAFNNNFYANVDGNVYDLLPTDSDLIASAGLNGDLYRGTTRTP